MLSIDTVNGFVNRPELEVAVLRTKCWNLTIRAPPVFSIKKAGMRSLNSIFKLKNKLRLA